MTNSETETISVAPEVYDSLDEVEERRFVKRAQKLASRLPFVRHAVAMWHAMKDDATPMAAKALIAGAILYFMLPVDLIPDFLGGLGFTDDAAVMIATLRTISSHLKPVHYQKADETLGGVP